MGTADWELYNLQEDPGETRDVSSEHPQKKRALVALWNEYVKKNNVIIPDRHMFESLEDQLPVRVPVSEGWPPMNFKKPFVPPTELVDKESE
jgi:arylsulfatase